MRRAVLALVPATALAVVPATPIGTAASQRFPEGLLVQQFGGFEGLLQLLLIFLPAQAKG